MPSLRHRFMATRYAKLAVDTEGVAFHGRGSDDQPPGDLLVAQPFFQEFEPLDVIRWSPVASEGFNLR